MTTPELTAAVKKNPLITGCIVLSVALALGIYFRGDAIPDANKDLDDRSTQASRYALNISNAVQLKEQLEALKVANKVIDSRMLHPTDIGINQQYFYKLESESGVKLVDSRQGRPGPVKGGYEAIPFTVTIQGDFGQVVKFLRLLEDGTHYSRVLTASCSGGRAGLVSLTLSIELLGRP